MLAQYIIYKLEITNKYWRSYLYLKSTAANTEKKQIRCDIHDLLYQLR